MSAFLMCPPTFFSVCYAINPWMKPEMAVDQELAQVQWAALRQALRDAGATVELIEPVQNLPDMVFAANYGIVDGERFIAANFRHAERHPEAQAATSWFRHRGYSCINLEPPHASFEGGEVFACAGRTWVGYGMRNDEDAVNALERLLEDGVNRLRLVDPFFYHLDTCFCPLDEGTALVALGAFDEAGRDLVAQGIPRVIALEREEAMSLAANSVVVDRQVFMPACPRRIARLLEGLGFVPRVLDLSEFLKAGGGPRCMVLPIDTRFATAADEAIRGRVQ